jgi:hypothetical protein
MWLISGFVLAKQAYNRNACTIGRPLALTLHHALILILHHALVLKLLFAAPTRHSELPCRIVAIKPWCFEILTETFGI